MTPFEHSLFAKELSGACIEAHFSFGRIYRLPNKQFAIESNFTGWENKEEYTSLVEAFKSVPAEIKTIRPLQNS